MEVIEGSVIITRANIERIKVVTADKYQTIKGTKVAGIVQINDKISNIIIKHSDKNQWYITTAQAKNIVTDTGFAAPQVWKTEDYNRKDNYKPLIPLKTDVDHRRVYDLDTLISCYNAVALSPNPFNVVKGSLNPAQVLLPFVGARNFSREYNAYLSDPDEGVVTLTADDLNKDNNADEKEVVGGILTLYLTTAQLAGLNELVKGEESKKTEGEFLYVQHMTAVCMWKSFTNIEQQMRTFRDRRLGAFSSAYGVHCVTKTNQYNIVTNDYLSAVSQILSLFPKLRMLIANVIIKNDLMYSHTRLLMAKTGMTSVSIISEFLQATEKTAAHVHRTIMNETVKFLTTYESVKEVWGDQVDYVKLLNPGYTGLDANHWPNLNYAAYLWACNVLGESYRNYTINTRGVSIHNISRLLSKILPDNLLLNADGHTSIQETFRTMSDKMKKLIGINVDELTEDRLKIIFDTAPDADLYASYRQIVTGINNRQRGDAV